MKRYENEGVREEKVILKDMKRNIKERMMVTRRKMCMKEKRITIEKGHGRYLSKWRWDVRNKGRVPFDNGSFLRA